MCTWYTCVREVASEIGEYFFVQDEMHQWRSVDLEAVLDESRAGRNALFVESSIWGESRLIRNALSMESDNRNKYKLNSEQKVGEKD